MKAQRWKPFTGFDAIANAEDLVCISRIRWRWADARLRALLAVAAQQWRVFFVEVAPACQASSQDRQVGKHNVRVAATAQGVWIVRPDCATLPHTKDAQPLFASVLRGYLSEAGVYDPVIWHLDATMPTVIDMQNAWVTLYLKPVPLAAACFDVNQFRNDAVLREVSDVLVDEHILNLPPASAWQRICDDIFRAACRRRQWVYRILLAA